MTLPLHMQISSCQNSKKKNLLSNLEQICNIPPLHRQHFYGIEKIRKCTKAIYDRKKSEILVNQICFKFFKEIIEFPDTLVYKDSNSRLHTTLYKKPSDCQNYLHAKSAHPFSLKKVFLIVSHSDLSASVQPSRNTENIPKT